MLPANVGNIYDIDTINGHSGVSIDDGQYCFPFFVLRKIADDDELLDSDKYKPTNMDDDQDIEEEINF